MVTRTFKSYLYNVVYMDATKEVLTAQVNTPKFRLTHEEAKALTGLSENCRVLAVTRVKETGSVKYVMDDTTFMEHAKIAD